MNHHYNVGTFGNVFLVCSSISNLIKSLLGSGCMEVHLLQNSSAGLVKCLCGIKKVLQLRIEQ